MRLSAFAATSAVLVVISVASLQAGTPRPSAPMKPDQVNTAGWNKAWTNLVNDVEQTFVPASPRLLAVETELVLGNPGPRGDQLTLTILDRGGQAVATVTHFVSADSFEHAMFVIPDGGIDVNPGETYSMKLSGDVTFGWKYIVGGYPKGAATFNGKPLLRDARSTFLFRTFGPE